MLAHLRPALRGLARNPVLSLSAIFCLALGLGATTAIFTAVNTALLRPLPFPEPDRLVSVFRTTPFFQTGPFSAPNYQDLARESQTLETLSAATFGTGLLQTGERSIRTSLMRVSDDYFAMLGARPLLGRLVQPGEAAAETPVVVLSEELWREHLGGDPAIVGGAVRLDGSVHQVVGILPRDFRVPHGGRLFSGDVWVPLQIAPWQATARRSMYWTYDQQGGGATSFPLVVRTAGDPTAVAQSVARAIFGVDPQAAVSRVRPMEEVIASSVGRPRFYLVLIAVFAGLAVALALAGLYGVMTYMVEQRRREIGIRAALGGTPRANLGLVVRGGMVLIALGLAVGLGGGFATTRLLTGLLFGVSPLDLLAWTAAPLLLGAIGVGAVLLAGRRAASVDPLVAIRE